MDVVEEHIEHVAPGGTITAGRWGRIRSEGFDLVAIDRSDPEAGVVVVFSRTVRRRRSTRGFRRRGTTLGTTGQVLRRNPMGRRDPRG